MTGELMTSARIRRRLRPAGLQGIAAAGVVLLALAACGSDGGQAGNGTRTVTKTVAPSSATDPGAAPTALTGSWAAHPGQADEVQKKLIAKGYECTKHSDTAADLRLCSKSATYKARDQFEHDRVIGSSIRFLSDSKGTVLLANLQSSEAGRDDPLDEMAGAVLPPSDAAVFSADGATLIWGSVKNGTNTVLKVKGWESTTRYTPEYKPIAMTKEQALPLLQGAKLNCHFTSATAVDNLQGLDCTDPRLKNNDFLDAGDASVSIPDDGRGIDGIGAVVELDYNADLDGTRIRPVGPLLSKAAAALRDPGIKGAVDWAKRHFDGVAHSAYVGQWLVSTELHEGASFKVRITGEQPNLGIVDEGADDRADPSSTD
ncbi:hypothetical protein VV02_02885 [Luteipulveratus mongoliensis]|uniref:Uncharacterized protein n=2 Tax=Luteipulveratus mongoliensis TaxID=571913 RepID=A0A0K1JEA6_9MICO|nr:hypothetical protein VV02_02885 [Luteipulveratus mongoliensis]